METPLVDAAAQLLGQMATTPPREPGDRIGPEGEARILELSADGHTQTEIARQVGCSQSTVSRVLADYVDTRGMARRMLEARALEMAKRFVIDAKPEAILRMLGKLDVVRDDDVRGTGGGVVVNIGTPGNPVRLPDVFAVSATLPDRTSP